MFGLVCSGAPSELISLQQVLHRILTYTEEVLVKLHKDDRGCEFMGEVSQMMLEDYNITKKPIATHDPQANSITDTTDC